MLYPRGLIRLAPRRRRNERATTDLNDAHLEDCWSFMGITFAALGRSELIGRPLGDDAFLDAISRRLNRVVTPRRRGKA